MVFRPPWAWEVRVGSLDPLAHSWGEAAETATCWGGVAQIWKEIAPPLSMVYVGVMDRPMDI